MARLGQRGAASSQSRTATPFEANAEGHVASALVPGLWVWTLGLGCSGRSARHQRCSAFTLEHVTVPRVSATSHRPQRTLVSVRAESSPCPHPQGGGCISEGQR